MDYLKNWAPNTAVKVGNKLYAQCFECGKVICINKWLLGSLHLCLTEEEIKEKQESYNRD